MNKTFTVFKFELLNGIKSKSFIFTTLFFMISIIGFSLFMRFMAQNSMDNQTSPEAMIQEMMAGEEKTVGIINNSPLNNDELASLFPMYNFNVLNSKDEIEQNIESKDINFGLVLNDNQEVELIYNRAPAVPQDRFIIEEILRKYYVNRELSEVGISLEDVQNVESQVNISSTVTSLNTDSAATVPITMAISMLLYILILMNGQIASMNVAREKNDRTMELLITSTKPTHLINGKVFASFVQSLISVFFIGVSVVIAYFINRDFINNLLGDMNLSLDTEVIIIAMLFFVFGYIMYLYIYAALGATVSKTEEINTALGPIMVIVILVYLLTIAALSNVTNPDNILLKILSFVPFSSLFTMHARYALTDVSYLEVGISLGILIVSSIILSYLSVKLYRSSSLNYGNHNKLTNKIKKVFKRNK